MGRRNLCRVCPATNADLIGAETESDEKQYSGSIEGPHTAPSGGAFGSEDSTRASFTMGLNRPVMLDSAPPLFSRYALEKSRLRLLFRPTGPCFQMLWSFFRSHRWDSVANDRLVLLQGLTARGA